MARSSRRSLLLVVFFLLAWGVQARDNLLYRFPSTYFLVDRGYQVIYTADGAPPASISNYSPQELHNFCQLVFYIDPNNQESPTGHGADAGFISFERQVQEAEEA